MTILDIIEKKRDKKELTKEEIEFFVNGYTKGEITDYQPIYMCSDCNKDIFLENVINIQIIDDTIKD